MKNYDLSFSFDENLQEVANNPFDMELFVEDQLVVLNTVQNPADRLSVLGLLGTYLRILRRLGEAQDYLEKAVEIAQRHKMSLEQEVTQKIRLAHVYQWQKKFDQSSAIFTELQEISKTHDLGILHDFIWQHSGKNFFDQQDWKSAHHAFERALKLRELRKAPPEQLQSSIDSIRKTLQKMN